MRHNLGVSPTRATSAPAWRDAMARRRAWRTGRGLLVALVALTAALVGHAAAGGAVPLEALLVLAPLVALTGVAVADRELRLPVLVALVVGVQVVAHLAASLTPGHDHHAPSAAVPGPAMLMAHLVAALLLGVVLRSGEVVLWRLVALLCAALGVVRRALPAPASPLLRHAATGASTPVLAVLLDVVVRRGPPVPATG